MIQEQGTFEYEGELIPESTNPSEIIVQGRDCGQGGKVRLVGLCPKIRFWGEKVVLIADSQDSATVRRCSFPVGETVFLVARAGDSLHVVRTCMGEVGLSLLRDDCLVFALGAVTAIPLGTGIQITPGGNDFWWKSPREPTWLDLAIDCEGTRLRDRDFTQIGGYDVYLEHCWAAGIPGGGECVSISRSDRRTGIAAMRSAILLAHDGPTLTDWDLRQFRGNGKP